MDTIEPFQIEGRVRRVLVCPGLPHRGHVSIPATKIVFDDEGGVCGDRHFGPKSVDVRDTAALAFGVTKGTRAFNTRQWSAVSAEENAAVAAALHIDRIEEGDLGENLIVEGIPRFSALPPGTQLFFKSPSGDRRAAVLWVTGANGPCGVVGQTIQSRNPDAPQLVSRFVRAAQDRRGLVGFTYCYGFVKDGDTIIASVPRQRLYQPPT